MHISKVELENIKSHSAATFEFSRGTTAITGENGAGKTTIIEAVAWVMFDLLEYKKEEFLKRGAKKGWVRITFESGLDEREYIVFRDTAAGYHVIDPRLNIRVADKKEEVFRFLWQHLGLEPGTDLRSLFKQAIGVPQGTFTAIFLDGATERKTAFDRLLKVEEYRQAAEKLRDTSRHLDTQIAATRETIARSEGELSRTDTVEAEHKAETDRLQALTAELAVVDVSLSSLRAEVAAMDSSEREYTEAQRSVAGVRSESERAGILLRQCEDAVKRAVEAETRVESTRAQAELHQGSLAKLGELERERNERDRLRTELARADADIVKWTAEQRRVQERIDSVKKAYADIAELSPKIVDQEKAEAEAARLRDILAAARSVAAQIASLDEKLQRMRESYRENQVRLAEAEVNAAAGADLAALDARDGELLNQIAKMRASLERDERFQSEIRNGLCPILSQKCLNLKPGETLEAFVSSQFGELREQIAASEIERSSVALSLVKARQAQQFLAAIDGYRRRESELKEEGQRLNAEKADLSSRVENIGSSEQDLAECETRLRVLDDPRSRVRHLENETKRETELDESMTAIVSEIERAEIERNRVLQQLEAYGSLDERWSKLSAERDSTADAYRTFIANDAEAKALGERRSGMETANAVVAEIAERIEIAEKRLADIAAMYDRETHAAKRSQLVETERGHATAKATLDAANKRIEQLTAELQRFAETRRSLAVEFREKERLEKVAEATAFIRDTLKEAAPRVARNYVYHVSLEANLMFREITGNAYHTLKWGEDYAIMLEEDGYERPFQSLSGGEQMAAALSIRLALLKQLSDIRIAFFDEPTTNMDAERRENLAMQLSRITHFDQLFVISHDETFDSYVDNVVSIGE